MPARKYRQPNMDPHEFIAMIALLGWKKERPSKLVRVFPKLERNVVFLVSGKDVTANIIHHKQNGWSRNRGAHGGYSRKFKHDFHKALEWAKELVTKETNHEPDCQDRHHC